MDARSQTYPARLILVILMGMLTACSQLPGRPADRTTTHENSLVHDGVTRTYRVLVPDSYDGSRPVPLILALHGGGGEGRVMCSLKNGIQTLANQGNFIVVCPDGIENHWNDGRELTRWRAHAEKIDDVGFLVNLIEIVQNQYRIDPGRIYATGVSNGGKMVLRLACEASEVLAGVAAVIASLPADLDCQPSSPVSIMLLNGTQDPLVPYEGGQVHFLRQELGAALSTPATLNFWVEANGCRTGPEQVWLPDLDPQDGTRIRRESYRDCDGGSQVLLYEVQGGGHTWPGGSQYVPAFLVGKVSQDAKAGELIWEFFDSIWFTQ